MKLSRTILAIAIVLAVSSASASGEGCVGHGHGHGHGEAQKHGEAHEHREAHGHGNGSGHGCKSHCSPAPDFIEVGEAALNSMGLKTVHPQMRRMRSTKTFWGRMELSSDARKDVPAPVSGRLALKVRELDPVKKGDVIFTVESPALKSLSREIEVLKSRLGVYRQLKTTNAEIESALKVKMSEKAALVAGAEEKDSVVTIRAAADAVVEKVNVADGAWVETGMAAATLVDHRALRFRALVVSSDAAKLRDGMDVLVGGVRAQLRLGIGESTGMIPVYAVFGSGDAPGRSGERIQAECVLEERESPVAALPDGCIVKVGIEPVVFVRDAKDAGRFLALKVECGISSGGWTEVRGLPHEGHLDVVKEGAYELKLALAEKASGKKASGHFHADGIFHEGEH